MGKIYLTITHNLGNIKGKLINLKYDFYVKYRPLHKTKGAAAAPSLLPLRQPKLGGSATTENTYRFRWESSSHVPKIYFNNICVLL